MHCHIEDKVIIHYEICTCTWLSIPQDSPQAKQSGGLSYPFGTILLKWVNLTLW